MRECSRNRPTIERTRMRLGQARARPAAGSRCRARARSIAAPACEASYSASMSVRVDEAVHLQHDPSRRPAAPRGAISSASAGRRVTRRHEQLAVRALAAVAGQQVEQVGEVRAQIADRPSAGRCPRRAAPSSGCSCPCRRARTAGCRRPPGGPRGTSSRASSGRPRRTRRARPPASRARAHVDVGLLVEARLQLDERDDLLARLGGPDERPDDRAVRPRCGTASA